MVLGVLIRRYKWGYWGGTGGVTEGGIEGGTAGDTGSILFAVILGVVLRVVLGSYNGMGVGTMDVDKGGIISGTGVGTEGGTGCDTMVLLWVVLEVILG